MPGVGLYIDAYVRWRALYMHGQLGILVHTRITPTRFIGLRSYGNRLLILLTDPEGLCGVEEVYLLIHNWFIHHSFILETYSASSRHYHRPTQRRSQPSHGQRRRTSGRCKIWKGGPCICNERSSTARSFHADGPTTENALRCTVTQWAQGTKSSPLTAERSTRCAAKSPQPTLGSRGHKGKRGRSGHTGRPLQ